MSIMPSQETLAPPGQIQLSGEAAARLRSPGGGEPRFLVTERGTIHVKGIGEMATFILVGRAAGCSRPKADPSNGEACCDWTAIPAAAAAPVLSPDHLVRYRGRRHTVTSIVVDSSALEMTPPPCMQAGGSFRAGLVTSLPLAGGASRGLKRSASLTSVSAHHEICPIVAGLLTKSHGVLGDVRWSVDSAPKLEPGPSETLEAMASFHPARAFSPLFRRFFLLRGRCSLVPVRLPIVWG